jgi:ketosteroid isomerase-like protein
MSEENVEVVRRLYEAVNRGDFDDAVQSMDPEVRSIRLLRRWT